MTSPSEIIKKFDYAMATCRDYYEEGKKGKVRAEKATIVEGIAKDILLLAIKEKGLDPNKIEFSRKKIPIAIEDTYFDSLPDYAKEYLNQQTRKTYGLKVDIHAFYETDFICVIECKAYTENAMLKRILFDFYLVNRYSPTTKTILFQAENWMGGDNFGTGKPSYSATTHALISSMPAVDFHLVTLTQQTRDIKNPIEFSGFKLEQKHINQAVNEFMSILDS